jgi:tetratricopeptide (TPR) repeat protein
LKDRVRWVRTEAARVLSQVPADRLSEKQQKAFRRALEEYKQSQLAMSDQAPAHHNLGNLFSNLGDRTRAEAAYRTAIRLDPKFVPARFNLAMLLNQHDEKREAERMLREVIAIAPEMADAHYSLGLLLAEDEKRLSEAAQSLASAARLAPNRARVLYNYGLAMQRLGRPEQAEAALVAAHNLEPSSPDYLYALAVLCTQQRRWPDARQWAETLLRINPDNPAWQMLWRQIMAASN